MISAARRWRIPLACLAFWLLASPASAQLFPFFDNRPSPPAREWRPQAERQRATGVLDLRRKTRRHVRAHANPTPGPAPVTPVVASPAGAAQDAAPPPYENQLLRLSEIMGALAYLEQVCAEPAIAPAADRPWRDRMQALIGAEGEATDRRDRLAGAFNRGLRGYELSYHSCTPNARLARGRFLEEGARLAHDISSRYKAN